MLRLFLKLSVVRMWSTCVLTWILVNVFRMVMLRSRLNVVAWVWVWCLVLCSVCCCVWVCFWVLAGADGVLVVSFLVVVLVLCVWCVRARLVFSCVLSRLVISWLVMLCLMMIVEWLCSELCVALRVVVCSIRLWSKVMVIWLWLV